MPRPPARPPSEASPLPSLFPLGSPVRTVGSDNGASGENLLFGALAFAADPRRALRDEFLHLVGERRQDARTRRRCDAPRDRCAERLLEDRSEAAAGVD